MERLSRYITHDGGVFSFPDYQELSGYGRGISADVEYFSRGDSTMDINTAFKIGEEIFLQDRRCQSSNGILLEEMIVRGDGSVKARLFAMKIGTKKAKVVKMRAVGRKR